MMAMVDTTWYLVRSQSRFLGGYHLAYKESVYLEIVAAGIALLGSFC